jgi:tRNA U34 5-carboxymethylaminomethyl modifying enzyme MnmG/GidA
MKTNFNLKKVITILQDVNYKIINTIKYFYLVRKKAKQKQTAVDTARKVPSAIAYLEIGSISKPA